MQIKAQIIGAKETAQAITRVAKGLDPSVIEIALVSGAMLIRNRASELAPYITGTLKRSIHVGGHTNMAPGFSESEGYSDIGGNVKTAGKVQVEVGTNLVYAPRVEYGFVGKDALGRVYNQPPHPYLRPAFEEKKGEALQEVDDFIAAYLGKQLKG